MRISDWSSDVCSSDLVDIVADRLADDPHAAGILAPAALVDGDHGLQGREAVVPVQPRRFLQLVAEIGRASCRESVCQYVSITVVAAALKKKQKYPYAQSLTRH